MNGTLINNKQSPTTIRVLGGVLIVLGLLLTGGMAFLAVWMNDIIARSGRPGSTTGFNGSPEDARMIFLVFAAVAAFGVASMAAGAWQVLTGTRNKKLIWLMFALWIVLMLMAWAVRIYF